MTGKTKYILHPFCRILFLSGSIIAVILFANIIYLLMFYGFFIFPLILLQGGFRIHLRLLGFGIVPIFLTFILLYIIIMKGSNGGWDYINIKSLKILCLTSVFQVALSIPTDMLVVTFKKWGFKGDGLLTMVGAFTVWAEVKTKSNQIITARFARGFIGKRNFFNTAKQLPYVLIPLIIGVMRTAIERVDVWEQREIPFLLDNIKPSKTHYPFWLNMLSVVVPWSASVIFVLFNYFIT